MTPAYLNKYLYTNLETGEAQVTKKKMDRPSYKGGVSLERGDGDENANMC